MSLKRSLLIKFKRANITNTTIDCSKECVKCITQTKLSKILFTVQINGNSHHLDMQELYLPQYALIVMKYVMGLHRHMMHLPKYKRQSAIAY